MPIDQASVGSTTDLVDLLGQTLPYVNYEIDGCEVGDDIIEVDLVPKDLSYLKCSDCGAMTGGIHSKRKSRFRDLDFFGKQVLLNVEFRKIQCPECEGVRSQELQVGDTNKLLTFRYARYIRSLLDRGVDSSEIKAEKGISIGTIDGTKERTIPDKLPSPDPYMVGVDMIDRSKNSDSYKSKLITITAYKSGKITQNKTAEMSVAIDWLHEFCCKHLNMLEEQYTEKGKEIPDYGYVPLVQDEEIRSVLQEELPENTVLEGPKSGRK